VPARRPPAARESATAPPPKRADEAALFRAAVADVRPLKLPARVARAGTPRPPRARFRRADEAAVLAESLAPFASDAPAETEGSRYRRTGVAERTLKRLARGEFAVRAEIDLHGLTRAVAREALAEFLAEAVARRMLCVRVIHGKGLGSGPQGPVLKPAVQQWLRQHACVAAFVAARSVDGGGGALYVLLAP
jgi:DNA-nicking Smr family endonuclease